MVDSEKVSKKMIRKISFKVLYSMLVLIGAGLLVSWMLAFVPDYYNPLSHLERFQLNFKTFITFDYARFIADNQSMVGDIGFRIQRSLILVGGAILVCILIGIPAGIAAALHHHSRWIRFSVTMIDILSAIPILVWAALFFIFGIVLGVQLSYTVLKETCLWYERFAVIMIPVLILAVGDSILSEVVHVVRDETSRIFEQDYIRAVRARNVSLYRHLSRALTAPLLALFNGKVAALISGAVVVEYVFTWKGLGWAVLEGVAVTGAKDYPLILGGSMLFVGIIVGLSLISDLIMIMVDPRLRKG